MAATMAATFGLRLSLLLAAIGIAMANDCPKPMLPENSQIVLNEDLVTYYCDAGFKFDGKTRNSTCKKSSWEKIKFNCQETCGVPPELPDAMIIHSREESVIYQCQTNSSLNLEIQIQCQGDQWEKPKEQCLDEFIPDGNNSSSVYGIEILEKMNSTFVPENALPFCNGSNDGTNSTCRPPPPPSHPLEPKDSSSLCIDGFISRTNVSCKSNDSEGCPEPWDIPNTIMQWDFEGNVRYTCNPGYIQVGDNATSYCENGTWTEINITCFSQDSDACPEPWDIPNTMMLNRTSEKNVSYICKSGFVQEGNNSFSSFCENGAWTELNMTCFPESCGPFHPGTGGRVTYDENTANVSCEEEFLQQGNVSISVCENDTWSEITATCISKAAIAKELKQRQESRAFQDRLENERGLICSFLDNQQKCGCNRRHLMMFHSVHQKIAKHNYLSVVAGSVEACDVLCLQDESCLSLEFEESSKKCSLSKTATYLVEKMIVMEDVDVIYREKVCTDFQMEGMNSIMMPGFNLSAFPPSALLCRMSREEVFCGCVEGTVSSKAIAKKKIAMHNMLSFPADDPAKCFGRCRDTPNCLSAEFKKHRKVCRLSETARYLADEYIFLDSPSTLYLEKICIPFENS